MDIPWEVLGADAPFRILFAVLFLTVFLVFCLYRLDKIPALSTLGVISILMSSKVADVATFLWSSGGEYAADEINPFYQIAVLSLPHFWAIMSVQVGVTAVFLVALWLLRISPAPRWLWLATVATFSAISLVGAATNVLYLFGLW